jgi:curved DNA-binding protein CbpA
MNTGDDPYDILSVSKSASVIEIRSAYRKLAMKHHPDKFQDSAERERNAAVFARVAAAYEILSDDQMRAEYDRQQEEEKDERGRAPGFDGNAVYDVAPPARRDTSTTNKGKKSSTGKPKKKHPMYFHDPYEVFKAAFEAEFGFPYPGADFDNIPEAEMKQQMKLKDANSRKPKLLTNGDAGKSGSARIADDTSSKKKSGIMSGVFGRDKKLSDETSMVVHDRNKNKPNNPNSTALVTKSSTALAKKKKGSTAMVVRDEDDDDEYGPPPAGNNRPASMETKSYKIEHPDGTVETIEETTITRPDGSTETMRRTDKPDSNTGNWKKPVSAGGDGKKPLAIGNGPERKMLTNGDTKKMLAIEDDKSKRSSKTDSSKTAKKPLPALENGNKPQGGRRLLGWGGGSS